LPWDTRDQATTFAAAAQGLRWLGLLAAKRANPRARFQYKRLLLVERVRPDRLRPTRRDEALARTDLNMLAGLGGRERSLTDFAALLELSRVQDHRHVADTT
jgi:hypothetical protein